MRIGIIAHLKFPISEPFCGGLEMHTHTLARRLQDRGHQVTLFASTHSDASIGFEAICHETSINEVGLAEARDVAFFQEHHAYLHLMTRLRDLDLDIIHNNSLHYLPVSMANTLPMPMITTLHTPPFCWLESGMRVSPGEGSRFVAVSESLRRSWAHITPVDHVVLNGIDLGRFQYQPEPSAEPYVFWHGRIVPEKGLHWAIDASEAAGVSLRFAGPILDETYFAEEIQPRLGQRARWLGHLAHKELASVLGGARAFVCTPCWEEPFGLVVAEALACGVPVAAFARGAIPEILDASCGALAAPDDVVGLAGAISAAQTLSRRACRDRARRLCNVTAMIDRYEAIYRGLINAGTVQKPPFRGIGRADQRAA